MQEAISLKVDLDPTLALKQRVPQPQDRTEASARQFEGMVMSLLFQTLRKTVEPSGLMGEGGQSRSTYEMLMDQAVVDKAVGAGRSWGLAERLAESWKQAASAQKASQPLTEPGKLPIGSSSR
ncbi:MAG TPA: rod-binding protein [Holophagaceae bacterium]|nr:rod-binding protein [Holophagaceae bacterium]